MKAYCYDTQTRRLTGSQDMFFDPVEERYCLPASATEVEPPEVDDTHEAVFHPDTNTWSIEKINSAEEDILLGNRPVPEGFKIENGHVVQMTTEELVSAGILPLPPGFKLVDGKLQEMSLAERITAGVTPMPDGYKIVSGILIEKTIREKLTGATLNDSLRASLCQKIDARLQPILDEGFTYPGNTVHYQADVEFQRNMTSFLVALLAGAPGPFKVRTWDNVNTLFTKEEFPGFAFFLMGFVQDIYQKVWDAKDLVRSMTSVNECISALEELGVK